MPIPTIHYEVQTPPPAPWMKCPGDHDVDYPGLAYIYPLDELIIAECREALHDLISKTGVAYTILNSDGEKVFLALLEKRFKRFHVKIYNHYGNEIIYVNKPSEFCANKVLVWAPPGNYVGSVKEKKICCNNTYIVKNRLGKNVIKIVAGMFGVVYKIYLIYGGQTIGIAKKQWKPALTMNNFGLSFPAELDVGDKAVLLGACFLIGFL